MANGRRHAGRRYLGDDGRDAGDGSRDEHALRSVPHRPSMLIATWLSLFALWLVSAEKLRLRCLLPGALVMGTGISAMHYTGMAALQFASIIVWNSAWLPFNIIALLASCGARCRLTFRLQ